MKQVNLHRAKTHLSRLVDQAVAGEDIVISKAGTPLVHLVPVAASRERRVLGLDEGKILMREDFDEPMPELEELFHGASDPA